MTEDSRIERDSFGDIAVPSWAYWGAQTQRSRENFPIGGDRMPIEIIHALARVKLAAARANEKKGLLTKEIADAIFDGRAGSHRRQARRAFPACRLADRLRHADQYERQ